MEPARDRDGKPITVQIDTRTGRLLAKVWLMHVGRVKLYLLDCDVTSNSPEDRELTSRLYGGDNRIRIRQELVPGVGGIRALTALGITPGVYHLNEGHSAFATLEAIRQRMKEDGVSFDNRLARSGPAHGLHHAHARAGRPRPLRSQPDRRAPWSAARRVGHLLRATDGPGPRRAAERARNVLHDRAGAEALAAGQRREQPARPRLAADVGPSLAVAGRRKKSPSATSPTASTFPPGWPTR